MNVITKNKMKMYESVKLICAENQSSWAGLPAFATGYQLLVDKLGLLQTYSSQQADATVGVSANKEHQKITILNEVMVIAHAIKAYAQFIGDVQLLQKMKISFSSLYRADRVTTLALFERVVEAATLRINELEDFGVTQQMLDDIIVRKAELRSLLNAPRSAILNRKMVTSVIKQLTKEIDDVLKLSLDQLAKVLQVTQPEFFLRYTDARQIIDYKGRSIGNNLPDGGFE